MGTSSSYGGPNDGTPLIPSWLDGEDENNASPNIPPAPSEKDVPPSVIPGRFRTQRNNFTRFAGSDGKDRASLGRAIAGYVSSASGGSSQAARRMGSSKVAAGRLANFLSSTRSQGVDEALRTLKLESLAGLSIEQIFLGLADYVCPEGGTVDQGIAREAFIETIADLAEFGITDLNALTVEQMQTVLELYATHAIEARLCNDIGTKINIAPSGVKAFERVQDVLHDFILRGVSDALTREASKLESLTPDKTLQFVDHVYDSAFSILESIGEQEAESI
ncbi:MAG: Qat anti-phage system associated protein QatB [Nitrospinales bacterium]